MRALPQGLVGIIASGEQLLERLSLYFAVVYITDINLSLHNRCCTIALRKIKCAICSCFFVRICLCRCHEACSTLPPLHIVGLECQLQTGWYSLQPCCEIVPICLDPKGQRSNCIGEDDLWVTRSGLERCRRCSAK